MKRLTFVALLLSGACTESAPRFGTDEYTINEAQSAAADKLRDPSSAQFSQVRISETGAVCGRVNGKNAFGAYSGASPFLYIPSGSREASIERGEFGAFLQGEGARYPSAEGLQTTDFETLYAQHCLGIDRQRQEREKSDLMNKFGND